MAQLFVGAGKACIDPEEDMYPMPTRFDQCEALYDSCFCRAIAIRYGEDCMMFLTYELSDQPTIPDLAAQIGAEIGWPEDQFIISVTHNHSSPCDSSFSEDPRVLAVQERYRGIELAAGIEACRKAVSSLRPARYGYGETESLINVNRDLQTPYGYWLEGRNLAGYSDKTLAMIKFVGEDGKLIAAILNHGTHATNIYLMRDFDGKTKLSGNFPGITCRFAEEHYGDGAVIMWTSAAAGNQNPLLSHGMQYEYPDGYSTTVSYPDGIGYMQMEYIGRMHGADAVRGLDSIRADLVNMPIRHVTQVIDLPAQRRVEPKVNQGVDFRMAGNVLQVGLRPEPYEPPKDPVYPEMVDDPEHPVPLKMQLVLLGNIALVCAGAELYAQIGRDIKETSPYRHTVVITHTQDIRHVGYIMDKSSVNVKTMPSFGPVKPGAGHDPILACEAGMFDRILGTY